MRRNSLWQVESCGRDDDFCKRRFRNRSGAVSFAPTIIPHADQNRAQEPDAKADEHSDRSLPRAHADEKAREK